MIQLTDHKPSQLTNTSLHVSGTDFKADMHEPASLPKQTELLLGMKSVFDEIFRAQTFHKFSTSRPKCSDVYVSQNVSKRQHFGGAC
jgi:hypothetical protein